MSNEVKPEPVPPPNEWNTKKPCNNFIFIVSVVQIQEEFTNKMKHIDEGIIKIDDRLSAALHDVQHSATKINTDGHNPKWRSDIA